jgi:crossover junction endodeoxyribonuclease RusA
VILKGSITIAPRQKDRPKLTKTGHAYNTKGTKDAQRQQAFLFRTLARQANLQTPVDDQLNLCVTVRFYHRGGVENEPKRTKPDIDNLLKLTLDAITNAGIWKDDNQITKLVSEDLWAGDNPGRIELEIEEHITTKQQLTLELS